MKWADGFCTDRFKEFWSDRLKEIATPPLIISGLGFDPRSMQAANILSTIGIRPKVLSLDFSIASYEKENQSIREAIEKNCELLTRFEIVHSPLKIAMFDALDRPVGGRHAIESIYGIREKLAGLIDVIIDIGGLPRALFAPLLSFLIDKQRELGFSNLHVASLPNELLDKEIISGQFLDPNFMYGFDRPSADDKFVWIPIIGKNDPDRLRAIYNKIEKDCIETCPVLPFRKHDPRQIDNLIVNLRDVLFGEIRTFYSNILYIDHSSPFAVYREIVQLSQYYTRLLKDLPGRVKVLITPLDDKTSSIGAILAAVERKLPLIYADTVQYRVLNAKLLLDPLVGIEPVEIWITGEAYDS